MDSSTPAPCPLVLACSHFTKIMVLQLDSNSWALVHPKLKRRRDVKQVALMSVHGDSSLQVP